MLHCLIATSILKIASIQRSEPAFKKKASTREEGFIFWHTLSKGFSSRAAVMQEDVCINKGWIMLSKDVWFFNHWQPIKLYYVLKNKLSCSQTNFRKEKKQVILLKDGSVVMKTFFKMSYTWGYLIILQKKNETTAHIRMLVNAQTYNWVSFTSGSQLWLMEIVNKGL